MTTDATQSLLVLAGSSHAMTCDVEDYFQVSAFEGQVSREHWLSIECRIPRNVDRALERLDEHGTKATFFTLGWVAEHHPEVIRRIVDGGHEIASHGMEHSRVWSQSAKEFENDARRARMLLEDVSGTRVTGYRAASWSIDQRAPWAHQVLADAGYRYSSSIYPIVHDHFGFPGAPVHPYLDEASGLIEIPASTTELLGRRIPIAGGGYFRLYPLGVSRWLVRREIRRSKGPYMFYFHPWELDPKQPRIAQASFKSKFRHYLNLDKFEKRWCRLLDEFQWDRMDRIYLQDDSG